MKEIISCKGGLNFGWVSFSDEAIRHPFYAPPQKVAGYYVIPSELLSVCPSVRPSAVDHSYPLHNFDTVRDNFTKLGTNIKHDQTTCRN